MAAEQAAVVPSSSPLAVPPALDKSRPGDLRQNKGRIIGTNLNTNMTDADQFTPERKYNCCPGLSIVD